MKKVLILGASRYYIKSIEATKRAGYYVIAVDRNPESEGFSAADEHYACDIIDKEGVLAIARKTGASAIVPVNDYGVPTAAYAAKALGIPYLSEETAIIATNKEEMRKRWIRDGVPCPKVEIASGSDAIKAAIYKVGLPCILKPAHGYGGASRGVVVIEQESQIEDAIRFSTSFYADPATLVESFVIAEVEHSAEVIVHNGKPHVIAIADKIKTPLPYRVDKNVLYPSRMYDTPRIETLKQTICDAVTSIGIHMGAAHVELATTKDGFVLFELGARCGGGGTPEPIVRYCTGVDEFVEQVRILAGDAPKNLIPDRHLGCNYHFLTPAPGKISQVSGIPEISRMEGVLDFEFFKKEGDVIAPVTVGTERSGFIIVAGQTREEALEKGYKAEALLKLNYAE